MMSLLLFLSRLTFAAGGEEYVQRWDEEDTERFINECTSIFPSEMEEKQKLCTCALNKIVSETSPYEVRMTSPQITGAMNACQQSYPWFSSLQKKIIGECVSTMKKQGHISSTDTSTNRLCSCGVEMFVRHTPLKQLIKGVSYGTLYSFVSLCKSNNI